MDESIFAEVACLIPSHYEAGMAAALDYDLQAINLEVYSPQPECRGRI
jgi:hypothetical protein